MTERHEPTRPDDGAFAMPEGLSEDAVVDLIDGALEPAEAARVRALVSRDRVLDRAVTGMVRDRATLRAMPSSMEPPPERFEHRVGPADEARRRVDRERAGEAVWSLAASIPEHDAPAEPTPSGGSPAWLRPAGLGLAAAVVLSVSAGVILVAIRVFAPAPPGPTVADQRPLSPNDPARVASNDPPDDAPAAPVDTTTPPDSAAVLGEPLRVVDVERAVELLAEQRLLVHAVTMRVDALADAMGETEPTARFRVSTDANAGVRAAVLDEGTGLAFRVARDLPQPALAWVEQQSGRSPLGANAWQTEPHAWSASLTPDARGVRALIDALGHTGARVSLVEVDEPIPAALDLSPESALWWSRPAGEWPSRAVVPVLVDHLELE